MRGAAPATARGSRSSGEKCFRRTLSEDSNATSGRCGVEAHLRAEGTSEGSSARSGRWRKSGKAARCRTRQSGEGRAGDSEDCVRTSVTREDRRQAAGVIVDADGHIANANGTNAQQTDSVPAASTLNRYVLTVIEAARTG